MNIREEILDDLIGHFVKILYRYEFPDHTGSDYDIDEKAFRYYHTNARFNIAVKTLAHTALEDVTIRLSMPLDPVGQIIGVATDTCIMCQQKKPMQVLQRVGSNWACERCIQQNQLAAQRGLCA